ncbi:MAG: hypothetical protein J5841_01210 [Clostridia bacterium]|nr:hypothetical protein [Clostridia bacterium]
MMMTKQKKAVSCLLCIILLLACLCGAAAAEEENPALDASQGTAVVWKVYAPEWFNTKCLLDSTFDRQTAEQAPEIEEEIRDGNIRFWHLKGKDGLPFCSVGPVYPESAGIQNRFSITRHADEGNERNYWYFMDEDNIIPSKSGYEDLDKAREGWNYALDLMGNWGLIMEDETAEVLSYSTLGRMEGATQCHKVVFGELLAGLPVRWAANALGNGNSSMRPMAEGCYAELVFSDEDGLLYAEASWCAFEPLIWKHAEERLTYQQGFEIFMDAGLMNAAEMESCWFLSMDGDGATATLAWRVGNNYLSAVDGTWLQTEK